MDVASDRRIKTHVKNEEISSLLDRTNALRVVNYDYIDKLAKGANSKTGFIAQEVEAVMPDAVMHSSDFIPNVFTPAECTETSGGKLIITTSAPHGFAEGDQIMLFDKDNKPYNVKVSSVPTDRVFLVNDWTAANTGDLFVYGKKVNDFRTVDFDQITALAIGSIQELTKLLHDEQEKNRKLEKQMANLNAENKATKADMDKMKASIETLQQIVGSKAQK